MTLNIALVTNIQLYMIEYISLIVMTSQYSSKQDLHMFLPHVRLHFSSSVNPSEGLSKAVAERWVLTDLRLLRTVFLKVIFCIQVTGCVCQNSDSLASLQIHRIRLSGIQHQKDAFLFFSFF